jgi:hypothetical protein
MKKNSIPQFIGVFISFVAIWFVNDFFLVSQCVDSGGVFNYSQGECLLSNGDVESPSIGKYLIAVYFFMGLLIAMLVSFYIRKIFKINP